MDAVGSAREGMGRKGAEQSSSMAELSSYGQMSNSASSDMTRSLTPLAQQIEANIAEENRRRHD